MSLGFPYRRLRKGGFGARTTKNIKREEKNMNLDFHQKKFEFRSINPTSKKMWA